MNKTILKNHIHLFKRSMTGKHRPPLRDLPKVNRGFVLVGEDTYTRKKFNTVREAASKRQIFNMHRVNVIT